MRADRLLSALLLLQAHGKQTGREMAARLAVSERTIHRDMEALSAAGVPVFALRGVRGGWQLDEQWRTEVPGLDEAELRAFLMAQPRIVGDQLLSDAAARALDKLLAALPLTLRHRAAAMRQRLYVDTTAWYGRTEDLAALPAVQEGLSRDRRLQIDYVRGKRGPRDTDTGPRIVEPLGLVAKGTVWYLVANTKAGYRTFRVSRIQRVVVLEDSFTRPQDFDLATYWKASTSAFMDSRRQYTVTLRVDPQAADKLSHWFHPLTRLGPTSPADRRITVQVQFEDEEQALFIALGFGSRADVVSPEALRCRVADEISQLTARAR
jgi:predicted DNA-binding transcriptional regulator YafY